MELIKADYSKKLKVLVVDDDDITRVLLTRTLEKSFDVATESSAAHAFETAIAIKPDCILLDINMPNINGIEFLTQLRLQPGLQTTPVFIMSSDSRQETVDRVHKLGVSGFFTKPLDVKKIPDDLSSFMHSLSTELISPDENTVVNLDVRDGDLEYRFNALLDQLIKDNQKVVVLSATKGVPHKHPRAIEFAENNNIIFLQVKSSLITRLPFLDSLKPVMEDIQDLLDQNSHQYKLIVDRPELFLMSTARSNKSATLMSWVQNINEIFDRRYYFIKKSISTLDSSELNEMANFLAQRY